MIDRPYTVLSSSMSLDGYLDDATDRRLVLSNDADLDRVDEKVTVTAGGDLDRAPLVETRLVGEVVLLRYALSDRCDAGRVLAGRSEAV
jgi:hypothetical protein